MHSLVTLRSALAAVAASSFLFPLSARPCEEPPRDQSFTVAVIPDTQNYVDDTHAQPSSLAVFEQETRYLATHAHRLNLAFVTHVGDVVQHGDGTRGVAGDATWGAGREWDRAQEALRILSESGVPFGVTIGNHDYDNYSYAAGYQPLTSTVMWKKYFGPGSPLFRHQPWYGGASESVAFDPGLSSFQVFTAGGRYFLHIALQMEASDDAIAWAQRVIHAHPGFATIITTHEYLNPPADDDASRPLEVPAVRVPANTRYLKGSPGGWNDAQGVWDKLITRNDQIFMVICGHAWGTTASGVSKSENLRIDKNDAGHPVYQILSDYQGNTKTGVGGDGWLRFMDFDVRAKTIHFFTYSPTLDQYAGRNGEASFNQAPDYSDFTLPLPVQVLDARPEHPPLPPHHGRHGPHGR